MSASAAAGAGKYRTVVVDPPWAYPEGFGVSRIPKGTLHDGRRTALPYKAMTLEEIKALPIAKLADPSGCHLYLWTTNRYLRSAYEVLDAWGFRHGQTLVWVKTKLPSVLGGAFSANVEFILFARRGTLRHLWRADSSWWNWPRPGAKHSKKPEAFIDMVEQVSPGPYVELFARRQRLGWDTWGNECFNTASLEPAS